MAGKAKFAVVTKPDRDAEFEKLLRQSAEHLKTRRPQLVPRPLSSKTQD